MTTFEAIILAALYLFAFSYMANCLGALDDRNTWITVIIIMFSAATFGIFCFPIILGQDIWNKLNKEEQHEK